MQRNAAIIGCGATGIVTAVHLLRQGIPVRLCDTPEQVSEMREALAGGAGTLVEPSGESAFDVSPYVSSDIPASVQDAELIIVCVSLQRQKAISDLLCGCLAAGQTVLFSPGNMASLYLHRRMREAGKDGVLLAEVSGNLWACRLAPGGRVLSALPYAPKRLAAYPSSQTRRAQAAVNPYFPTEAANNILETTLNSPNVITHVSGVILNSVGIDTLGERFCLFRDGLSETVARYFNQLENERNSVLERAGLEVFSGSSSGLYTKLMHVEKNPELKIFRDLDGPSSTTHRYVSEDAPCGVTLLISLAKEFGVEIPLTESFYRQVNFINGADYYRMGYTLEALNLEYTIENGRIQWKL